jgi:hypothetical protein
MHLGPAGACGGLNFWNGPSRIAFGIRNLLVSLDKMLAGLGISSLRRGV